MHYAPKHSAARKRHPLRNQVVGAVIAATTSCVASVSMSQPAHAAGSVWDAVAACESTGNWAINSGNGFYGGLQFSKSTWSAFGGSRYASYPHQASKSVQIGIAQRTLAAQGPGAWPVCGKRAGLTRSNGNAVAAFAPTTVSRSKTRHAIVRHARIAVDGVMGTRTVSATQRWVGIVPTGFFGKRTLTALQRRVGAKADGVMGSRTVRALQVRVGVRRDGATRLNRATVLGLQRYLNRH